MPNTFYDTVGQAADVLARSLAEQGFGTVDLQPGNGSRYEITVVDDQISGYVVALPDFGSSARFGGLGWVHNSYVSEKLMRHRGTEVDAQVIADLIEATGKELARLTAPVTVYFDEDGTITDWDRQDYSGGHPAR